MINTVVILTDFEEFYTIQMIGKILSVARSKSDKRNKINFLTLNVKNYSLIAASFSLYQISKEIKNAVFVCVVDPYVGTKRRSVIIEVEKSKNFFTGPDNGIFSMIEGINRLVEIDEHKFNSASKTFHGRDIFAAIAGEILNGKNICNFGKTDKGKKIKRQNLKDKILYIDNFGNIITSIENEFVKFEFGKKVKVKINGQEIDTKFVSTFADEKKRFILYKGSSGFIEIGKFMENAAKILNVKVGDKMEI